MRVFGLLRWGCMLVLGATFCHSQTIPLIHVGDTAWRYYQDGHQPTNAAQPGLRWREAQFNDSAWNTGLGVFGFEESPLPAPIKTQLWLTPPGASAQTITYYFRAHFNWSHGTNALLFFTNLLDDGAVVYLNGAEIYRYRISGTPTYASFATAPPQEGVYEMTNVFRRLNAGDNVLAVELHQATATSADVVFGLALAAAIPEPVAITRQPPSLVDAIAGQDVSFSVQASGSRLRYAWHSNGVFLSRATNATLSLSNITTRQAATYRVIVSNDLNAVRSSNVVVRVVPDTFGPRIISATSNVGESSRLYIWFDEDVLRFGPASATNVNKYLVTAVDTGQQVPVTRVAVAPGLAAARLDLAASLDRRKTYEICLFEVADLLTNYIALNSCVPVSYEVITNSFTYGSFWWVYDWLEAPPTDWKEPEYIEDPRLWYDGRGMFYNSSSGVFNPPCTAPGHILSLGPSAYYFRKRFTVPTNVLGRLVTLTVGSVVDDGAVFYLNGVEIMRMNMPADPVIAHETRALGPGNPNICASNTFAVGHLLRQTNVLAVEVHQVVAFDLDAAFDGAAGLKYLDTPELTNRPPEGEVFLRYSNHSPAQLRLYWTNGMGYALEYVNALGDQWRELQPPSTNVLVDKAVPARFYRLNKRH